MMTKEQMNTLFQQIIEGDESAFRLLYDEYAEQLYHFAYSFLHEKETAEEAVLDVFTTIWNKRKQFSHVVDIKKYLYMSVKNQSLHYIRKNNIPIQDSLELYEIELQAEDINPEDMLLNKEYKLLIQNAVNALPPRCREVFRLVLSDKLKNREIADLLCISEKTVNEHIALAYKRVAKFVRLNLH
jgi:RNA polymerase sigma-70 factor (ECF subfamily)